MDACPLFNQGMAASGRDHRLVIDVIQRRKLADGRPITCQLVRADYFWDVIFTQQMLEECRRRRGVALPLEEHVEHGCVFVDSPPSPMDHPTHDHVHLVQRPPGTPPGFPVAQVLSEFTTEIDAPGVDGFAGHFDPPLKQQPFDVPITQGRAVGQPDGMADDRKRESVPWKLLVAQHGLTLRQQLARTI